MSGEPLRLTAEDFGEQYYAEGCGRPYVRDDVWLAFFSGIADSIVSTIAPRRVLDAGCALGILVELLRARGVEAYGFDLSSYAIAHVPASIRGFCWEASVGDEICGSYDLIICQEVFPHVAPADAEAAIQNFCRHTNDVLFSSSPVDPAAPRHVNLQPPEHWAAAFARWGFYRDHSYDASYITPWAVRYRRSRQAVPAIVRAYEARLWELRAERDHAHRAAAAPLEGELAAARRALAEARDRIRHMERSWFWRARSVWSRASGR